MKLETWTQKLHMGWRGVGGATDVIIYMCICGEHLPYILNHIYQVDGLNYLSYLRK